MRVPGFGRKIAALTLQDVFNVSAGIVGDVHVTCGAIAWGWTDEVNFDKADDVAMDVEGFLPVEYWKDVNPTFAGLRQLWWSCPKEKKKQIRKTVVATMQGYGAWEDALLVLQAGHVTPVTW